MYNYPYPQPQYPIQQNYGRQNDYSNSYSNQLLRVNGIEGARAYQMHPNTTVALFDTNSDTFYLKSTDAAGFPSIRVFDFAEKKEDNSTSQFVTKQQYNTLATELKQELEKIKETINYGKQSRQTADSTNTTAGKFNCAEI